MQVQNPKFLPVQKAERDEMPNPKKRATNIYIDLDIDHQIRDYVHDRARGEPMYSLTRFINDAARTYLLALQYQAKAKDVQETLEYVRDALKAISIKK